MDAEQLAKETGLSLEEAQELLKDTLPAQNIDNSGKTDVEFLQDCFPHIPLPVIQAKLAESGNLEQASDLLLNYDTLKEIKPVYLDKNLLRQAKQSAKNKQKQKSRETRHEKDLAALESLLPDIKRADLKAIYASNGQNFDLTVTTCTMKNTVSRAPHIQSVINGLEKPSLGTVSTASRGPSTPLSVSCTNPFEERDRVQQALEASLEQLEGYRRNKSIPKQFLGETQARISSLQAKLILLDSLVADVEQTGNDQSVVDFHNMTVSGALAVCEQRLGIWIDDLSKSHLYLITGAGRHSARGIPLIKNAIGEYLRQVNSNRYLVREEEGAFFLTKTLK